MQVVRCFFCLWTLYKLEKSSFSLGLPLDVTLHILPWKRLVDKTEFLEFFLSQFKRSYFLLMNCMSSPSSWSVIGSYGSSSQTFILDSRISFLFLMQIDFFFRACWQNCLDLSREILQESIGNSFNYSGIPNCSHRGLLHVTSAYFSVTNISRQWLNWPLYWRPDRSMLPVHGTHFIAGIPDSLLSRLLGSLFFL